MFEKCPKCNTFGSRFDIKFEYKILTSTTIKEKKKEKKKKEKEDMFSKRLNETVIQVFDKYTGQKLCSNCYFELLFEEIYFMFGFGIGYGYGRIDLTKKE